MKFIEQKIDRLAELARLELSADERKKFVKQLDRILRFMEKLDELELNDEIKINQETATPLRKDEAKPGFSAEQALRNASKSHDQFFVVPRVVKKKDK